MQKSDDTLANVESVTQKAEKLYDLIFRTITAYSNPSGTEFFEVCNKELFSKLIFECYSLPIYYYLHFSLARLLIDGTFEDIKGDAAGWLLFLAVPVALVITSPIDFPIACFTLSVGAVASMPVIAAEQSCLAIDKVIDTITNRRSNLSRSPYLQFLFQQSRKLLSAMHASHVDENELKLLIDHILKDIKILANSSSRSIMHLGNEYLDQAVDLAGLRHCITGRSKLADLIHKHILSDLSLEIQSTIECENDPTATECQNQNRQMTTELRTRGLFSVNQTLSLRSNGNNSLHNDDVDGSQKKL